MYNRGVLQKVLDEGGRVYTIGPSGAFLRYQRRPVVFTRRELADRAASAKTLTVREVRSVDLSATIREMHGSGLGLCVIHDYDADDAKFKSITLHARSGVMDSVKYLERCLGRNVAAAEASPAPLELRAALAGLRLLPKPRKRPAKTVSNIVTITCRFWYSLVLYAIVLLLEDDLL